MTGLMVAHWANGTATAAASRNATEARLYWADEVAGES